MLPEDRLDAALSVRLIRSAWPTSDEGLLPLMDAADSLVALRDVTPPAAFARTLELRLMAHAGSLVAATPMRDATVPATIAAQPATSRRVVRPARVLRSRLLWPAIAAALVLSFTGALGVALAAPPGSPLYGLHKWEDGVRVSLASSPADRVRLHLRYAAGAISALDQAAGQNEGAYRDALSTLRSEESAARQDLEQVPPGGEHETLSAQLDGLRGHARHDLRAALTSLSWPLRVSTTQALAQMGDSVPHVQNASLSPVDSGEKSGTRWRIVLTGTGFQPGAVLLINGAPMGEVRSVSSTQLTAEINWNGEDLRHASFGVGNVDGTAAAANNVRDDGDGNRDGTTTPTPGGNGGDHSGSGDGGHGGGTGGDGSGSHGGDHTPTPNPSPKASPTPTGTPEPH